MTTERPVRRALILEGGGAKGAYSLGCLLALAQHDLEFDVVAGTSVGALNAVCWSARALAEGEALWRSLGPCSFLRVRPILAFLIATLFFPWLLPVALALAMALFLTILTREYFTGQLWSYARVPAIVLTALLASVIFGALRFGFRQPFAVSLYGALWLLIVACLTAEEPAFGELLTVLPIVIGTIYTIAAAISVAGDFHGAPSYLREGIWLGPLIASPFFLHALESRVAILSSDRLRRLAEPILARGLTTPTFACSARLARTIDPNDAVLGVPSPYGPITFSAKRLLSYLPCYERLDDKPPTLAMEYLLASTALPLGVFRSRKIHRSRYVDGGLAANLPLGAILPFAPTEVYIVQLRPLDHAHVTFTSQLKQEARLPLMEELSKAIGAYFLDDPEPIRKDVANAFDLIRSKQVVYPLPQRFVALAPAKPLGRFFTGTLRFQRSYIDRLIRSGREDTLARLREENSPEATCH